MLNKGYVLTDESPDYNPLEPIQLSGAYFIPTSLLLFAEHGIDGLSLTWREKSLHSFTQDVYFTFTRDSIFNSIPKYAIAEMDDEYGRGDWEAVPVFSLYNSKLNACTHYFKLSDEGGWNVKFINYRKEEYVIEIPHNASFIHTFNDVTGVDFTLGYAGVDLRHYIASNLRLCQKKVLSISIG